MNLSIKQKIRFIIWGSITLASYWLAIIFLFHNHELLLSLTAVFSFFIAFHFFYLEIYKFHWKYFLIALVLGLFITGIIITPQTIAMWIANIWFHIMIALLGYSLYWQTEWKIWFDGLSYFSSGWYLFTMALALVYSTIVVNFFSEFPMNCKQLNEESNKVIVAVSSPFKISREKTQEITNWTKTFFSSTFKDLSLGAKNIEISSPSQWNKLVKTLITRKENLITKTLQENEKLNNTICDFTLRTINEKLQSPTIQYPVIILIIFLIYPFLRIIVRILSFIGLFIFELWYLSKLYTKQKETREVERIG